MHARIHTELINGHDKVVGCQTILVTSLIMTKYLEKQLEGEEKGFILVHNFIIVVRASEADFISQHPGIRERGVGIWLGSSMPPFILLGSLTHGTVPPTLWVGLPPDNSLWKCPITNLSRLTTTKIKHQVIKSNCISDHNEQSENELKDTVSLIVASKRIKY